ncbi:hypothetical protein C8F04DRAFT_1130273 [Mycena alexandri]|uniref:Uncharacterized protein n=1 Tax=Mycena alexandri TaxID=1745969 RepID=A0AAD6SC36_9AGAR|nr:hypothetical protein C8F04DRAFT_1130273 [Mycena alexandri]
MGHGHAFYTLVLKLYLVLVLTPVALCQGFGSSHSQPGSSSSSSGKSSSQSSSSSLAPSSVFSASVQSSSTTSHIHRSRSSTSDTRSSTSDSAVALSGGTTATLSSPPPEKPRQTAPSPPTDPSVSPAGDFPPAPSSSSTNQVLASTKSNHQVPIIAGVVAPVVLIALGVAAWVFYRRHHRVRDRREWERTHASIADAVRQVASPGPIGRLTPGAQWGHMDLASRTGTYRDAEYTRHVGDTITDPFVDSPAAHQHAEYDARPPITAMHSPTFAPQYSGPFGAVYDDEYAAQAR